MSGVVGAVDWFLFGFGWIVLTTTGRSGTVSLTDAVLGSEPTAAAVTWYVAGKAQAAARVQPRSDLRPLQLTWIDVGAALRTITVVDRIADGQSWVDHTFPVDVNTFATKVFAVTSNVHAGRIPLSWSTSGTTWPAAAVPSTGATVTSSAAQGPSGSAGAVGVADAVGVALEEGARGPMS